VEEDSAAAMVAEDLAEAVMVVVADLAVAGSAGAEGSVAADSEAGDWAADWEEVAVTAAARAAAAKAAVAVRCRGPSTAGQGIPPMNQTRSLKHQCSRRDSAPNTMR